MKEKKNKVIKETKKESKYQGLKKLKLLVTVIERSKTSFYIDLLEEFEVNFQFVIMGQGTATNEIKSSLGIIDNDKTVIFSVIREDNEKKILNKLEDKFNVIRNGKGIAYTIPFDSVVGVFAYSYLANKDIKVKKD